MIHICLADNFPIVHYGVGSFFKNHSQIQVVSSISNYDLLVEELKIKKIDVLIVDLELEGLKGIIELKTMLKDFSKIKVLVYTNLNEAIYAPNILKAGFAGFLPKTAKVEQLNDAMLSIYAGNVWTNAAFDKKNKDRADAEKKTGVFKKLSNREVQVLRYLKDGKKNLEIASILNLNEKTISTYKLRLLHKLNVTNLIDLVKKAETLGII